MVSQTIVSTRSLVAAIMIITSVNTLNIRTAGEEIERNASLEESLEEKKQ